MIIVGNILTFIRNLILVLVYVVFRLSYVVLRLFWKVVFSFISIVVQEINGSLRTKKFEEINLADMKHVTKNITVKYALFCKKLFIDKINSLYDEWRMLDKDKNMDPLQEDKAIIDETSCKEVVETVIESDIDPIEASSGTIDINISSNAEKEIKDVESIQPALEKDVNEDESVALPKKSKRIDELDALY